MRKLFNMIAILVLVGFAGSIAAHAAPPPAPKASPAMTAAAKTTSGTITVWNEKNPATGNFSLKVGAATWKFVTTSTTKISGNAKVGSQATVTYTQDSKGNKTAKAVAFK